MPEIVQNESSLSDALLRQLMAVGQVDILVGLPTLDNAATVAGIVRAIHQCFTRDFPRLRTVMINSDGCSTDGTPEIIRAASVTDGDLVQTSHALRTLHRVVAPYHGLPGKLAALRTIFAAVELTQAKVVVVIDPNGPAVSAERITELIAPITRGEIEFLSPRYRRHPRDGLLVTQLVRPLVRALYGVAIDEPLGVEFSCSGRFASHCLDKEIWTHEVGRFAIDLWLRTEAVACAVPIGQIWRPAPISTGTRTTLREAVQQVVMSLVESLASHEAYWLAAARSVEPRTWGEEPQRAGEPAAWDHLALAAQARHDLEEIRPLLEAALDPLMLARIDVELLASSVSLDDELWSALVYDFVSAALHRSASLEHLASMFVPFYMWRASAFMASTASDSDADAQARLDALCATFERLKPRLVSRWPPESMRSR